MLNDFSVVEIDEFLNGQEFNEDDFFRQRNICLQFY